MESALGVLMLFVLVWSSSPILIWGIDESYFNVINYGAKSDGSTDDSKAFAEAWDAACKSSFQSPTVYVPPGKTFLVNPTIFEGPCKSSTINFVVEGTVIAPDSPRLWDGRDASQWLAFMHINGLNVSGSGVVDGRGKAWWDQSCKYNPKVKTCTSLAPTAWKFLGCNEGSVRNVKLQNSAQTHILVNGCDNFTIFNVTIDSPRTSPNTDGIHIGSSHHILITNSTIANGDDCISIGDHSSDLQISHIQCSLGHGISVGSLGKGGSVAQVGNINVTDCIFNQTTNGARIKTWQVGRGNVNGVTFERLTFNDVENPIIITQNYCDVTGTCPEQKTGVQISNVTYRNMVGTSASEVAINLDCSKSVPCYGISMESIHLTSAVARRQVTAQCSNARDREDDVVPGPCLQHAQGFMVQDH